MKIVFALFVVALLASGIVLSFGVPLAIVFGWIPFLIRTIPRMTIYWPSVIAGVGALTLFIIGVHRLGVAWRPGNGGDSPTRRWRFRTTLTIVAGICVLFAAGIALVGIVHQTIWLATAAQPLVKETVELPYRPDSRNNLRQLIFGMHNYASASKDSLPSGIAEDGTVLHGWGPPMLIFLNYYDRDIDLKLPWDHPKNQRLRQTVLPDFINPDLQVSSLVDENGNGLSHYAANSHVLGGTRQMKWSDITDGTESTLLLGEVNANFKPWASPYNYRDPTLGINRSPNGFGGPRGSGGALFGMADGSVRFVSEKISPSVLRAISTPRGGEDVDIDAVAPKR